MSLLFIYTSPRGVWNLLVQYDSMIDGLDRGLVLQAGHLFRQLVDELPDVDNGEGSS